MMDQPAGATNLQFGRALGPTQILPMYMYCLRLRGVSTRT